MSAPRRSKLGEEQKPSPEAPGAPRGSLIRRTKRLTLAPDLEKEASSAPSQKQDTRKSIYEATETLNPKLYSDMFARVRLVFAQSKPIRD